MRIADIVVRVVNDMEFKIFNGIYNYRYPLTLKFLTLIKLNDLHSILANEIYRIRGKTHSMVAC